MGEVRGWSGSRENSNMGEGTGSGLEGVGGGNVEHGGGGNSNTGDGEGTGSGWEGVGKGKNNGAVWEEERTELPNK